MQNRFVEIPASKKSISKRKLIRGVGTNDADYVTSAVIGGKSIQCHFYVRWRRMIDRCYSKKYQEASPTYIGCSVCKEWLLFSNFKKWMIKQDWKGKQLDKDIIKYDNKVYSPDTCVFVSLDLNSLIKNRDQLRGEYPKGVTILKSTGKFIAQIYCGGKNIDLGRFVSVTEAAGAYKNAKSNIILAAADKQADRRIKAGLRLHAKML